MAYARTGVGEFLHRRWHVMFRRFTSTPPNTTIPGRGCISVEGRMPVRLSNPRRGFIYNVLPKYCRARPKYNPSRGCVGTLVLPCCYRYVSPNGLYRTGLVGTVTRYGFSQPYRSKHCHTLFPSFRPCRGAVESLPHPATELSPLSGRRRNVGASCYRAFAPAGASPKRCHKLLTRFRP